MSDLEGRVSHLEKEVAELQGQLKADMRHIDKRFDEINDTFKTLFRKLDTLNTNISQVNATGQLATQSSSANEKLIWAIGAVIAGVFSFAMGALL